MNQEKLKKHLKYNEKTGFFYWNVQKSGIQIKSIAGSKDRQTGYIRIMVDGKRFQAHRLAWLYVYGKFPKFTIDHINHKRDDNRICNLRDVSLNTNLYNQKMKTNNKTGYTGIQKIPSKIKCWRATIKYNKKCLHIGVFQYKRDAINARREAEMKYNYHKNHGKNINR